MKNYEKTVEWKKGNNWNWEHDNSLKAWDFYSRLKIAHPFINNMTKYRCATSKMQWLCKRCKRWFWRSPKKLLYGRGCPDCEVHFVYLVRLHKYGCYKIGVAHNMLRRFRDYGGATLIFYRQGIKENCYKLEKIWLENVRDYKLRKDFGGGTETFEYTC